MRARRLSIAAVLFATLSAATARGADRRDTMLVSPAWLAAHLSDPALVLLHVGDKADYDARHIQGARYVTLRDVSTSGDNPTGLTLEMPPAETLRSELQALGISDHSHIVVYYAKDQLTASTRLVFTMLYAGLDNVSLLDGGMPAWAAAGQPLTAAATPARTGVLAPLAVRPLIVDADFVRTHATAPHFAVVDARDASFYDGSQIGGPRDHRVAGHIPGARNVPFSSLEQPDGTIKPTDEVAARFQQAGVQPGDTVIAYCHIGMQATTVIFGALLAGHPVLLYDGSFEDWARRGLPVENPAKKND